MDIRLATGSDHGRWDEYVASNAFGSFMQSWGWGEVQRRYGTSIWRVVAHQDAVFCGTALILKRAMPMGRSYFYIPRGLIQNRSRIKNQESKLLSWIKEFALKERAVFIRIDPLWNQDNGSQLSDWRKAEHEVQPKDTLVIDLQESEDELLADMHQKTRYNIRLAERQGVTVRFSTAASDLDSFFKLAQEVSARGNFHYHPEEYYRVMHEVLGDNGRLEIGVVEHGGDILAVHLLVTFGRVVTYVHGASSSTKRELMGPHLLQWETIKRAKAQGKTTYDFFGVAPVDAKDKHSWAGLTRFKEGFGGRRESYIGAYDLVLDPMWYAGFTLARRIKCFL